MLWVKGKNWNLLEVAVERKKVQVVKEKLEELKEKARRRQTVTDRNSEKPPYFFCSQRKVKEPRQPVKEKERNCDCGPGGGGVLPYMSYIGMCRCEGYGFQRVYS